MSDDRKQKMLALLASSTNEGEAMAAWRMLHKVQPEGRLFGDGKPTPSDGKWDTSAYAAGHRNGYRQGVETMARNVENIMAEDVEKLAETRARELFEKRQQATTGSSVLFFFMGMMLMSLGILIGFTSRG